MPEILKTNNIGNQGLATDPQPWTLEPEFLTDGINFRILSGSILAKGGDILWSTPPVSFNAGHLFFAGNRIDNYWIALGRSAVYSFDGDNWVDISSTAGYANLGLDDELRWTSCKLGSIPIFNNPQSHPEYWGPPDPAQILQPLMFDHTNTWKQKGYLAKVIRSHKNFLFALNLNEGGTDFLDSYRWSHPADINGLPVTWDETNEAFLAGKSAIGGNTGSIIDGFSLRDAFCIYSDEGISILDYTNDEFVWRKRALSSTLSLLSSNAILEIKGTHFFLADGDIASNDGTNVKSIAHNRIKRDLSNRIDVDNYDRSYAVRNNILKEIWFCIPETGATYPNIAYIYNWRDDSWAIKDIPITTGYSAYGLRNSADDTWDSHDVSQQWDDQIRTWLSGNLTPLDSVVIGIDPDDSALRFLEPDEAPDNDFNTRIERTDFPLIDERQVTTITRVYPQMSGTGDVLITFGSQDRPGAAVRWKTAVTFNPLTDRKIDIRTTGELHAWKFESIGKAAWILSGMIIEFERAGFR